MTAGTHDGPGFMIGAQAFLDLGHKLDGITQRLDYKPVYKQVAQSAVIPSPTATLQIPIPEFPARGRVWNILKILVMNTDQHTPLLAPVTTPAIPASTVPAFNNSGQAVAVTVTGGTVTAISVNGVATGATSGSVIVPAYGWISITYSVVPTSWTWAGTSTSAVADVYASTNADLQAPALNTAIAGNMPVPSIVSYARQVEWCQSGASLVAVVYNAPAGSQIVFAARVAEYPTAAVEAMFL